MTVFNPNAPTTVGLEWVPARTVDIPLQAGTGQAQLVTSTVAETCSAVAVYLNPTVVPSLVQFDVYDVENMPAFDPDLDGDAAVPNRDVVVGPPWQKSDGTTSNFWQAVDNVQIIGEPPSAGNLTSDWISFQGSSVVGRPAVAAITFGCPNVWRNRAQNVAADPLTGRRQLAVRVRATCEVIGTAPALAQVTGILSSGGGAIYAPQSLGVPVGFPTELEFGWANNPITGFQWTAQDILAVLTGQLSFGVQAHLFGDANHSFRVYAVQLEVVSVPETRTAVGRTTLTSRAQGGWVVVPFTDQSSGALASWGKTVRTRYAIVGYSAAGTCAWTQLVPASGTFGLQSGIVPFGAHSVPAAVQAAPGVSSVGAAAFAFVPVRSDGNPSADCQPYQAFVDAQVHATASARQELASETALAFGIVSVLVKGANVTAPLQVALRKTSDNSLLAGPANVEVGTATYQQVRLRFPTSFTPTLHEGIYVEAVSATSPTFPWSVGVLFTDDEYSTVTAGGTSDAASLVQAGVFSRFPFADLPVTLTTVPAPLTSVVCGLGVQDNPALLTGVCAVPTIHYAALTWAPSGLGGTFFCYEVDRLIAGGWTTVARITTEENAFFNDFEAERNLVRQYRARVIRNDGAFSDWATSNTVNVPATAGDMLLVTNEQPDVNYAAQDQTPHTYTRPNGAAVTGLPVYGQDKYVGFRPSENRGDKFTKTFVVAFDDPAIQAGTVKPGRDVFDPILTVCEDVTVPYVNLCDGDGRSWYTAPAVQTLTRNEPQGQYLATVDFFEVAGPSIVTTPNPWASLVIPELAYGEPGGVYGEVGSTYAT